MNTCLLAVCLATLSATPVDTLVVCPAAFRPAADPRPAHLGVRPRGIASRSVLGSQCR